MSDAAIKDQPEVAVAAAEAQTTQETAPAAATTEQSVAKMTEAAPQAENGADKTTETTAEQKAQADRKDFKKNRKYDPSTQPVTDDPVKIRNQVEFYFSDSNLPTDKFMWESTEGEANKPMALKTICAFKRMRQFQPYSAVVAALRESSSLEISGEEGEEVVKRKKAYVSSTVSQKARLDATVYVKGFGEETQTTQFDIEAFFVPFGPVKMVKLRRTEQELFKSSVFVEFETAELADAFVSLDPKPTWKGGDLLIMKKLDYLQEKNRQIKEGILEPSSGRRATFFEGKERGGGRGGRGRGRGGDNKGKSDDWKNKRDGDNNNNNNRNGFKGGRGRGRGRGGRGGRGRGGRDNHRDRDDKKSEDTRTNTNDVQMPTIQSSAPKNSETNGKRAREDDGAAAPPAKKIDIKTEA
ncbi:hypothetical protein BT67DRAFT_403418 [Trichocladium antarcticum]|uniref:RNA-binding La domain protein n=1 Tax=Trichocladium antarcticum TaxID=1450529 RepID=A0AAN6UJU4_9PEZI|nr:hypothetical protein BT67DRAFT_403418 [Trichocladium antarcticum]